MDEKHRQYCIKLGNPYMKEERYQEQLKANATDTSSWIPEESVNEMGNWLKNSKKFTN